MIPFICEDRVGKIKQSILNLSHFITLLSVSSYDAKSCFSCFLGTKQFQQNTYLRDFST